MAHPGAEVAGLARGASGLGAVVATATRAGRGAAGRGARGARGTGGTATAVRTNDTEAIGAVVAEGAQVPFIEESVLIVVEQVAELRRGRGRDALSGAVVGPVTVAVDVVVAVLGLGAQIVRVARHPEVAEADDLRGGVVRCGARCAGVRHGRREIPDPAEIPELRARGVLVGSFVAERCGGIEDAAVTAGQLALVRDRVALEATRAHRAVAVVVRSAASGVTTSGGRGATRAGGGGSAGRRRGRSASSARTAGGHALVVDADETTHAGDPSAVVRSRAAMRRIDALRIGGRAVAVVAHAAAATRARGVSTRSRGRTTLAAGAAVG